MDSPLHNDVATVEHDRILGNEPLEAGERDEEIEEGEQSLKSDVLSSPWQPSGRFWTDAWYFVGPGWLVCIAYVDPGNYQADIAAGATTK